MMKCGASQRNSAGWARNRRPSAALQSSSPAFTTAALSTTATSPSPRSSRVSAVSCALPPYTIGPPSTPARPLAPVLTTVTPSSTPKGSRPGTTVRASRSARPRGSTAVTSRGVSRVVVTGDLRIDREAGGRRPADDPALGRRTGLGADLETRWRTPGSAREELLDLLEEPRPGRLVGERQVVAAVQ